ncbi:MAG: hypothetical protein OQL06_00855 [Gammaproteobacteria bacterium]|nr:hypothetical protein [Gammaproteobacteria bacterium]
MLPEFIVAEGMDLSRYMTEDIISPVIRKHLQRQGIPLKQQLNYLNPTMVRFLDTFDTYKIQSTEIQLKYVPVAIGASDAPLESMIGISLEGKSAKDMYVELVLPELNNHRK